MKSSTSARGGTRADGVPSPRLSGDGDPVIQVRGLRKSYAGAMAIDGVDLDVNRGEIFVLLGPNGAGKTTTVEILEGHRQRTEGSVSVLGVDPSRGNRAWRARIGLVLQSMSGFEEFSVREIVRHFAGYYADPYPADEAIGLVGLTAERGKRVKVLSGGQRRRLDVALGIVGRPELLFLDEPTTGFDPEARLDFWALLTGLATGGTTIVLTTHYLHEAEALADRVAVMKAGRIIAMGPTATLGGTGAGEAEVSWTEDGIRQSIVTRTPTVTVFETARRLGGEIPDLSIARPSLEDVYLRMIGSTRHGGES
jgi:ABC-2 type transport system ATP-binding protein